MTDPSLPRYFSVSAPAPHNKSGTARITVRIGGAYPAYLCVGNGRVPLTTDEAWAVWVALGNALTSVHGPAPAWAAEQIQLTSAEVEPSAHGPGASDLEIYHERVKELRGKGLDAVTARLRAMDEARQRIDEREQAWHEAQAAAEATRNDPEVSR
ncbi:hypothetical protein ACQPZZ_29055 [Microbispora sp. CA-135349]|uniref:hypothetical protein n=1 Tax=Microbispora sp. CA-135349 TaxID=3239953 RepID=UPI003D8FBE64